MDNRWNRELDVLAAEIRALSSQYANVTYVDLRAVFKAELTSTPVGRDSGYLPTSAIRIGLDALLLRNSARIDRAARARGLQFTLDGAHLNSRGAAIVAGVFAEEVERVIGQTHPSSPTVEIKRENGSTEITPNRGGEA
jgi:hypothetical protein